jgi:signal transduction histidine kinase
VLKVARVRASSLRFDEMTAPLALVDARGVLAGATEPARRLLSRLGPPGEQVPGTWRDALLRGPGAVVWESDDDQGSKLRVDCTAYPIDAAHTLLVLRDVADRERHLSTRLRRQADVAASHVAASIAYHLRAPLASMVLSSSAMRDAAARDPAEVERILRDLDASVESVRQRVDTLLDFAHVGPPRRRAVPLRHVIDGVRQLVGLGTAHQLAVSVSPEASAVSANEFAIERILVELVENAVSAVDGAARMTITTERVAPDRIELHFKDEGPGVQPAIAHLVFEPFFTTRSGHTGIGLTTARDTARSIGGALSLRATLDGALFVLALPTLGRASEHAS